MTPHLCSPVDRNRANAWDATCTNGTCITPAKWSQPLAAIRWALRTDGRLAMIRLKGCSSLPIAEPFQGSLRHSVPIHRRLSSPLCRYSRPLSKLGRDSRRHAACDAERRQMFTNNASKHSDRFPSGLSTCR